MTDPLISAEELAKRLGVSVSLVYKLAQQKKIPCYRVGDNWRFNAAEALGVLRQERQAS